MSNIVLHQIEYASSSGFEHICIGHRTINSSVRFRVLCPAMWAWQADCINCK